MPRGKHGVHVAPIERMLARKVVDADGCWVWPGAKNKVPVANGGGGYGQVMDTVTHKTLMVHLVSYEHFNGPVPGGMVVDHQCHNEDPTCPGRNCKHRLCWNSDHLIAKSFADNCAAGTSPGARAVRSGWCQKGLHERTPENLITSIRKSGTVASQCRPCFYAAANARRRVLRVG